MNLHELQCYKPVKPCIGKLFDYILITISNDEVNNVFSLTIQICRVGIGITINDGVFTAPLGLPIIIIAVDAKGLQ